MDQLTMSSSWRLFVFCLAAAVGALLVVSYTDADAWFLFPIGIATLALLSFLDGLWSVRS